MAGIKTRHFLFDMAFLPKCCGLFRFFYWSLFSSDRNQIFEAIPALGFWDEGFAFYKNPSYYELCSLF
jgi:hypothetical protein